MRSDRYRPVLTAPSRVLCYRTPNQEGVGALQWPALRVRLNGTESARAAHPPSHPAPSTYPPLAAGSHCMIHTSVCASKGSRIAFWAGLASNRRLCTRRHVAPRLIASPAHPARGPIVPNQQSASPRHAAIPRVGVRVVERRARDRDTRRAVPRVVLFSEAGCKCRAVGQRADQGTRPAAKPQSCSSVSQGSMDDGRLRWDSSLFLLRHWYEGRSTT